MARADAPMFNGLRVSTSTTRNRSRQLFSLVNVSRICSKTYTLAPI
jgi:hypothetical protein